MKFVAGPVAILIAALTLASVAHAQDASAEATVAAVGPDADLASIRESILYARYAIAEPAIVTYLARVDLTATQRNAGLEARAILQIARRRLPDARATLAQLYARDPEHTIRDPDAGPDVRNEFDRARAAHPAHTSVTMEDATPRTMEERASPTVEIRVLSGGDAVSELRLWYRNGSAGAFQQAIMEYDAGAQTGRSRVPLADGRDEYAAQYYVDALAPSGAALERLGNPENPLTVMVPTAPEIPLAVLNEAILAAAPPVVPQTSVIDEWWFWTIIGVVVVGAGVGLYFGISAALAPSGPAPGTLGEGHL